MTTTTDQPAGIETILAGLVEQAVETAVARVLDEHGQKSLVVNVAEAAELMRVSRRTIETWVADGVVPKMPHTGRVLIPRHFLETWVAENARPPRKGST